MNVEKVRKMAYLPKDKLKPFKMEKNELTKFFRDEELFNPEKDRVTMDYFKYSGDDYPVQVSKYDDLFYENKKDTIDMFDMMV